ncbi:MAG: hypothetical protein MZW92_60340 [Comamonadaceae bacterium]|nr:hypothetical protein [Comamonadaceae bacterium]
MPVCDGPARQSSSALIICHDGMFPEMAREAAYTRRRGHPAHGGLHRADPSRLAASPTRPMRSRTWRSHGQRLHVRQRRQLRLDGRGDVLQLRRHRHRRRRWPPRRDPHRRTATRPGARGARRRGASRTTSTSSATAATLRSAVAARGLSLHLHAGHGRRPVPAALGGQRAGHRRHVVRLRAAGTRLRRRRAARQLR